MSTYTRKGAPLLPPARPRSDVKDPPAIAHTLGQDVYDLCNDGDARLDSLWDLGILAVEDVTELLGGDAVNAGALAVSLLRLEPCKLHHVWHFSNSLGNKVGIRITAMHGSRGVQITLSC